MSIITPPAPLVRISNRRFIAKEEMRFKWRGCAVTVPEDYVSDGASIPWLARLLFPPISEALTKMALGHDRLYERKTWDNGSPATRAEADRFAYDICTAEGMLVIRALLIRWGLALGSWWRWYGWRMTWLGPRRGRA